MKWVLMPDKLLVVITEEKDKNRVTWGLNFALKSRRLGVLSDVNVLFWGDNEAMAVSDDADISTLIESLKAEGVTLWACKGVAKNKGIANKLESLGIRVESATKVINESIKKGFETAWF